MTPVTSKWDFDLCLTWTRVSKKNCESGCWFSFSVRVVSCGRSSCTRVSAHCFLTSCCHHCRTSTSWRVHTLQYFTVLHQKYFTNIFIMFLTILENIGNDNDNSLVEIFCFYFHWNDSKVLHNWAAQILFKNQNSNLRYFQTNATNHKSLWIK